MSALHTPSFDMGRAAGLTAAALGAPRPTREEDVPAISRIMDDAEGTFFWPSSYIEGFLSAYDQPGWKFSSLQRLSKTG